MEKKTVKYHIPQHGIYMYARTNSGKTELIVLTRNMTVGARQSLIIEL